LTRPEGSFTPPPKVVEDVDWTWGADEEARDASWEDVPPLLVTTALAQPEDDLDIVFVR
jgi:hypothetical protein